MAFPPLHIHQPQTTHTHTVILLHGRGSDGPEFAGELFSSTTSGGQSLPVRFPGFRWVFPTSRERRDTKFQEDMPAWFDAYSLTDIHERQKLQVEGLKESVQYVLDLIRTEVDLLDRRTNRIFLGGISQGMATSLWALLCSPICPIWLREKRFGGFLAFCGWLPFAQQIEAILHQPSAQSPGASVSQLLLKTMDRPNLEVIDIDFQTVLETPVFLSHGTDDGVVDVALGRQAHQILSRIGIQAEWREYLGADNEGHWIKEPEGFDDIKEFFESRIRESVSS